MGWKNVKKHVRKMSGAGAGKCPENVKKMSPGTFFRQETIFFVIFLARKQFC